MRRVSLPVVLALASTPLVAHAQAAGPSGGPASPTGTESPSVAPGTGTSATATPPGATALPAAEPEPAAATPAPTHSATAARAIVTPTPAVPAELLERRQTQIIELHGYLRTRVELFNNFGLGWDFQPAMGGRAAAVQSDTTYSASGIPWVRNPELFSSACGSVTGGAMAAPCFNTTQLTSNLRLRLDPEIHPTEFIGIYSQVDVLDNLVLGSTPEGYYVTGRSTAAPITAFNTTQITPTAGYNTLFNSIAVKRAWAEVTSQTLGQIRFGRQPSSWGLGMVANAGNTLDSDYQSTADRIQYAARIRPLALFFAAAYDFASSGATSANRNIDPTQGQIYDTSLYDDVRQVVFAIGRRMEPEQQRASLARGDIVLNAGFYGVYRWQFLSGESATSAATGTVPVDAASGSNTRPYGTSLVHRGAWAFVSDGWVQLLGRNFRIEVEAAYIRGQIESTSVIAGSPMTANGQPYNISQFGAALETDYRLLNNRLTLHFNAGYASGDPDIEGLNYQQGLRAQGHNDSFLTLFRFHPNYRVDLIFWRQIQTQVSGAYYFRPGVQYNFIDEPNGDLFFGRVDAIWSRATDFIETRGNHSDLGVELDGTVQYQSNHRGVGSSDPRPAPGFYAFVQYGVFFPLGGLGPTDVERQGSQFSASNFNLQIAQTVRAFLGVAF